MPLLRNGRLLGNDWLVADAPEQLDAIAPDTPLFATLDLWQQQPERLSARPGPRGVRLRSDQGPEPLVPLLDRLAAVALEFPRFTDGRPYSHARLLRERHGFAGELRAVGQVLRDQLAFMLRCGFDSIELPEDADVATWLRAAEPFEHWYQAAGDGRSAIAHLRRQRRRGAA